MRRLSLAGNELSTSDIRVIDVAIKYGYDTSESFSRAFARFHGVSPSQAKQDVVILSVLLGHSKVSTTLDMYCHALDAPKKQGMEKMEAYHV